MLSAGQEQLVAFARILVRDPRGGARRGDRPDGPGHRGPGAARHRPAASRAGSASWSPTGCRRPPCRAGRRARGRPRRAARPRGAAGCARTARSAVCSTASASEADVDGHDHPDTAAGIGSIRRSTTPPPPPEVRPPPSLTRATWRALTIEPQWGLFGMGLFLLSALTGAFGAVTGWLWGLVVTDLRTECVRWASPSRWSRPCWSSPLLLSQAFRVYPRWWISVRLRVRAVVLNGQTMQHRLERTPPGEVVARTMDADRLSRYADRWVDFVNGLIIVLVTALLARTWLAGLVLLAVMVSSALASSFGRRVAGRSAAARPRRAPGSAARWSPPSSRCGPSSWRRRPPRCTPTCGRSTPAGSTRQCASTGCRRCSTACPS